MTHPSLTRRDLLRRSGMTAGALAVAGAVPAIAVSAPTAASAGAAGATATTETMKLARVWVSRATSTLIADFDDTHMRFADGSVEVLLWPGDLARLQATGLKFEVTVADLVARDAALYRDRAGVSTVALQPGQTATGAYRRLADFERELRELVANHPTKARLIELPLKTLEKRTVYGIEIATDVANDDGRPVFYTDGCHHAREWPAAELPLMFAYDLLGSYGTDPRITNIVDNVRTIIVPVVNPDGYNHSRESLVQLDNTQDPTTDGGVVFGDDLILLALSVAPPGGLESYWRKNRRSYFGTHLGAGTVELERAKPGNADVYGVDPNRNYGYSWGDNQGGSTAEQTSQSHRGATPFSDAEAGNVAHVIRSRQPLALITNHTAGDLVLWPWGDTTDDAPDNDLLQGLGEQMAAINGYTAQKSIGLYPTTGTTIDHAYGTAGTIGYTFEHAGASFHPPYLDTVPAMYALNRQAFLLLIEQICLAPATHAVISGRLVDEAGNGVAGTVRLYKEFDTLLWREGDGGNPTGMTSYRETLNATIATASDGTFAWHVNPSTRPAVASAGDTETYELTLKVGGAGLTRDIAIARGETLDLGDIRIV